MPFQVTKAESEEILRSSRRTVTLDVAASNRFIDHAIPDLTAEQRGLLRMHTAAVQAAAAAGGGRSAGGAKRNLPAEEEGRDGADAVAGRSGRRAKRSAAGGGGAVSGGASAKEATVNFLESLRQGASEPGAVGAVPRQTRESSSAEE